MKVRTAIVVNDSLTPDQSGQLIDFLMLLRENLEQPEVSVLADQIEIRWLTTKGTIVEAAGMWFPMLIACWVHIDRTIESRDITEVRFEEIP